MNRGDDQPQSQIIGLAGLAVETCSCTGIGAGLRRLTATSRKGLLTKSSPDMACGTVVPLSSTSSIDSFGVLVYAETSKEDKKRVSDHCPVSIEIR